MIKLLVVVKAHQAMDR